MARKANGKRSVNRDGSVRVHGKASNGEGSVYLDADGSWRATYVAPGTARPKRVRGKTREEAIARRAVKLEELSQIQSSTFHRDATVAAAPSVQAPSEEMEEAWGRYCLTASRASILVPAEGAAA